MTLVMYSMLFKSVTWVLHTIRENINTKIQLGKLYDVHYIMTIYMFDTSIKLT